MIVLKYNFNTVFINIYNNVFMSKTFWTILFGEQIFSPPRKIDLLYFLLKKPFTIYFNYLHTRISVEEWIDSINYLIKISVFLVFIIFLTRLTYYWIQIVDETLQARDLIDQVDRERGANRSQSRGIQLIHAKRLTHHPNTRYTLLVMDSWYYIILLIVLACVGNSNHEYKVDTKITLVILSRSIKRNKPSRSLSTMTS